MTKKGYRTILRKTEQNNTGKGKGETRVEIRESGGRERGQIVS
jgi:hypothetical protein